MTPTATAAAGMPDLMTWQADRDAALALVGRNAGETFSKLAKAFVVEHLKKGPATGEELTDAAKAVGIVPETTDKAFGSVYMSLARQGVIEKCGFAPRLKGHGCGGANVWRLAK